MKLRSTLLLFACLHASLYAAPLPASLPARQDVLPERLDTLNATMRRAVDSGQHAGAIWLLARNGRIVNLQTHGYRNLAQQLPMERDTICRIYSMSKIITSVGVLCLLEDGAFRLEDPVAKYLPELGKLSVTTADTNNRVVDFSKAPAVQVNAQPVTIKHLLTHTSGFAYDFTAGEPLGQRYRDANLFAAKTLSEFTANAAKIPLKHQPGEAFTYGINTDLLGALIERVSGQRLGEFLRKRIFTPLQMSDTGFHVPKEKLVRFAKTYQHDEQGKLVEAPAIILVNSEPNIGLESGGGGMVSTADDYARFAQMLLNGGALDGKRILSRKTVELMTANHMVGLPNDSHGFSKAYGFGLGVEVQLPLGRGGVPGSPGAFGWSGAATTLVRIDPTERLVAVLMTQHFPYNEHKLFETFLTGFYQTLK